MSTYHTSRQPQTGDRPGLAFRVVKLHRANVLNVKICGDVRGPENAVIAGAAS